MHETRLEMKRYNLTGSQATISMNNRHLLAQSMIEMPEASLLEGSEMDSDWV